MRKAPLIILVVIFTLLLVAVQAVAGPDECPPGQRGDCRQVFKVVGNGVCKSKWIPNNASANGWLDSCPSAIAENPTATPEKPAAKATGIPPTSIPKEATDTPPTTAIPPTDEPDPIATKEDDGGDNNGTDTYTVPTPQIFPTAAYAAVAEPGLVCLPSVICVDPCCPLDPSEIGLNEAMATREVAEAGLAVAKTGFFEEWTEKIKEGLSPPFVFSIDD